MFFDSWTDLARLLIVGPIAYLALIACLRLSGNRTLSKLNAFDLIVTVALGSTLATVLLSSDVSLAEGILALVLLVLLQYTMTWLSVRSPRFQSLLKSEPVLLMRGGRLLPDAMRRARITAEEIDAALRADGVAAHEEVSAVVLETDGSLSVIRTIGPSSGGSTLDV